jgi:hypothetical protein
MQRSILRRDVFALLFDLASQIDTFERESRYQSLPGAGLAPVNFRAK